MVMEGGGREAVLGAYAELKLKHPELPSQLRQFQVACGDSCVTISALGRHFEQSTGQGGGGAPNVRLPHWIWEKSANAPPWSSYARRWMTKITKCDDLIKQVPQSSSLCLFTPSKHSWC